LFLLTLFPLSSLILGVSEGLRGGVWAAITAHAAYNLSDALVPDLGTAATVVESALFFLFAGGCWAVWRRSARRGDPAAGSPGLTPVPEDAAC
jgi:membrane protease YdiL (CAAX protease family)